ncbi:Rossmann-fold NAD(P)-binding domain-containing protein [Actinacidiphila oryziradicis]|uniref:hypothetical protein n=1 Tax=Actinacidiphila oryziradicis TaxID=2571141 RepID=UPI001B800CD9|nr:hypothetical protein [Actinacidiphila oryziradicis]
MPVTALVTGATGALHGAAVELPERIPAERIGFSIRDAAEAQHFADRGERVRQGSYEVLAALQHSFEGAEQVPLISSHDPHDDSVALRKVGIEAAVAAGAQRILYTSHQGVALDSPFPRHATTPPPSSSWPTMASRGRATASTPAALPGCWPRSS